MKKRFVYKNKAEEAFCKWIDQEAVVSKRGWPDFFCKKNDGKIILVEVKDTSIHPLKKEQMIVARFLKQHGIEVYRWDMELQKLEDVDQAELRIKQPRRQKTKKF